MCFTSVIVMTCTSLGQASQDRSGHSGELGIHSCHQTLLESTKKPIFSTPKNINWTKDEKYGLVSPPQQDIGKGCSSQQHGRKLPGYVIIS